MEVLGALAVGLVITLILTCMVFLAVFAGFSILGDHTPTMTISGTWHCTHWLTSATDATCGQWTKGAR